MHPVKVWIVTLVAIGCVSLVSCRKVEEAHTEDEQKPATVVHQEEKHPDQPTQITLTEDAQKRVDVQTAPIEEMDVNGAKQKSMPFAALFYTPDGATWAFINTDPLTYVRQRIKVDRIVGDKTILAQGPPAGTKVVTVGASLLLGSENEFEEE